MPGYWVMVTGYWSLLVTDHWMMADGLWFLDCHGLGFKVHGKRQKLKYLFSVFSVTFVV